MLPTSSAPMALCPAQVVYLDEPTTGLDPISRHALLPHTVRCPRAHMCALPLTRGDGVAATCRPPTPPGSPNPRPVPYSSSLPLLPCRRHLWELVHRCKAGRAIVLTTHSMEEADILGDRWAHSKGCGEAGIPGSQVGTARPHGAQRRCTHAVPHRCKAQRRRCCRSMHPALPLPSPQDWHHGTWPPALPGHLAAPQGSLRLRLPRLNPHAGWGGGRRRGVGPGRRQQQQRQCRRRRFQRCHGGCHACAVCLRQPPLRDMPCLAWRSPQRPCWAGTTCRQQQQRGRRLWAAAQPGCGKAGRCGAAAVQGATRRRAQ